MKFLIYRKSHFFLPALIFILVSGVLIFSWFRYGFIYGGGDVGLPTYDPSRTLKVARYIWWESAAPGYPVPQGLTSVPLLFIFSFLQLLGFSSIGLQAVLFFVLLFLMGFGMYFLTLSIFTKENSKWAILAGLFYMLNPYMMIQVWHRFIHTTFILAAALPFFFLFFRSWIQTGKYSSLLLFLLTNLLSSYLFGTIAFIVTVWIFLFLVTAFEIFIPWQSKKWALKLSLRFIVGCIFWVLLGSWWLIPIFGVGAPLFSEQQTNDGSLITLLEISKQAVLPYSLQMVNPFYLFETAELGDLYKNTFIRLIPWIFVIVISLGFIKSLRDRKVAFFGLFFAVAVFLSKGAATPFGYPFIFAFTNLFFMGALRNPFEKLGIFLPFTGSILFAVGLAVIYKFFSRILNKQLANVIILSLMILVFGFSWPMISGTVFGRIGSPPFIKVPDSYLDADKWLNSQNKDGNILHLPLTRQEGLTYKWEYGYNGVEPSQLLFTSLPSISRGFNIARLDDSLTGLSLMFERPYSQNPDKILQLLQNFNVKFIVLHKDMVWQGRDVYDPQKTEEILDRLTFLSKKTQFKDLIVYELSNKYYQPKIVVTTQVQFVSPQKATIRMWPWLAHLNEGEMLTPLNDKDTDTAVKSSNEIMIFPQESFNYLEGSEKSLDIVGNSLVNLLYQLSNTKNSLKQNGDKDNEKLVTQLLSAGEDLINSYSYLKSGNLQLAIPLIDRYSKTVTTLIDQDIRSSKLRFYVGESTFNDFFKLQLLILENLKINELLATTDKIRQDLNKRRLLPTYPYISRGDFMVQERRISRFKIPKDGKYELLLTNSQVREIYPEKLANLDFQIDDKLLNLKGQNRGDLLSFGELELKEGTYEISFNNVISTNLIPPLENITRSDNASLIDKDTVQLSSDGQKASYIEADLGPVSGEDSYQIMFDGSFLSGIRFNIQIIQDGDSIENGEVKPRISTLIYRTKNDASFQSFGFKLPPLSVATRAARIRIIAEATTTSPKTIVQVKNLKVFRVLDNGMFLRSGLKQNNQATQSGQITEMKQRNPVLYQGNLKIDKPSFIIFKESYHPGWELTLSDGGKAHKPSKHFLSNLYGNAWYIEKEGKYDFSLEFKPQQKVNLGLYLAIFGWIISLSLVIGSKLKRKWSK